MAGTDLLKNMAERLEEREAWDEAVGVRAQIMANPKAGPWDRFFYARALLYAGRLDEAQTQIADLPDSNDPAVLMLKADFRERLCDAAGAEQLWTEALQAGGSAYWCLFGRARSLSRLGRLDEAKEIMTQALGLPESESGGEKFAKSLENINIKTAGALVELNVRQNPALEKISFDDLLMEMLFRIRGGETVATNEHRIAWAQDLADRLAVDLETHANRFSVKHIRDLFWSLYQSINEKPPIKGSTFLDLGSGSHNPMALGFLFVMLGAREAFAVDLEEIQDPHRALRAMARCADVLLTDAPRIVADYPISREEIDRNLNGFDLRKLRLGEIEGIDTSRLRTLHESAARLSIDDASVDVIVSNSFLEHVQDVESVLEEMARVTVRGGFGIHQIDGVDHAIYADPSLHPLNFLRNPKAGMVNESNRLRPLEFPSLFERHRFAVQQFISFGRMPLDPAFVATLAEPWRSMPLDVLEHPRGSLVVRRR